MESQAESFISLEDLINSGNQDSRVEWGTRNNSSRIFKLSKKAKDGVKSKIVSRETLQKNLTVAEE